MWRFDSLGRWVFRKLIDDEDKLDTASWPE